MRRHHVFLSALGAGALGLGALSVGTLGCGAAPPSDRSGDASAVDAAAPAAVDTAGSPGVAGSPHAAAPAAADGGAREASGSAAPPSDGSAQATSAHAPATPLPKGTVVLHVGDSFVHSGLTQELRKKLEPLGVKYEVRAEKSTNSLDWAKRMPELVSATQPDLVIVTLGGNEIGSKYLDVEARAVERIVQAIGNRPCVWTTPPLWMEESGVFDAIQTHLGSCRFFETDAIVGSYLPRRDGIHPTMEGGAIWGDALFAWLDTERVGGQSAWALRPAPETERTAKGRRGPLPH
jgi:hypothetical protein